MKINLKRFNDLAQVPKRAHATDAGYDLYSATSYDIVIEPHKTVMIDTGIGVEIPEGYFGGVYARSGLACKESLRPANCVGVVDCGYINSIMVALHNDSDEAKVVGAGERIAQLIIQPILSVEFEEVDELGSTERGLGGFGSTGKN